MRTAGQGQATVPWERGSRRRGQACLRLLLWAVGEHPPDCHEFRGALSFSLWGYFVCGRSTRASFFFVTPAHVRY